MKCEYGTVVKTDYKRGKQKYSEKCLSQFNIYHRQSQIDRVLILSDLRGYRPPNNHLRHCTAITSAV
jgi:formylmethanofuran dehydrogenase subunit B